jgi:hypothetical protein
LLFHIADHALVHCLDRGSVLKSLKNSEVLTYSFIGHLLVVNEVNDANRTQDSTSKCCLRFG